MDDEKIRRIEPTDAIDSYLEERAEDASYETHQTIKSALRRFIEWTNCEGIDYIYEVGGFELTKLKTWCKNNTEQNIVSLNCTLCSVRRFFVFCVRIEAADPSVPNKVPIPNVPGDEDVNYDKPTDEEVEKITQFLSTNEPTSRRRVEFVMMKEIGLRVGELRAIDKCDVMLDEQYIKLRHRPEREYDKKGTPLKNKKDGERQINISEDLAEIISNYLANPKRPDVEDEFGRKPLLTTKDGRPATETIRRDLYKLTRPCKYSGDCPEGRNIESCEATYSTHASKCPLNYSPHPMRRWAIENQIERGVSKELLVDRVDVSVPVLNKHYDTRSEERRREQRLRALEKIFYSYGDKDATLDENLYEILYDQDGHLDPHVIKMISSNEVHSRTMPENDKQDDDIPPESDNQSSLTDFSSSNTVLHPGIVPIYLASVVGAWLPDRLNRELNTITAKPGATLKPSRQRAVKGLTAYSVFILLLIVNFGLLGLLPA